MFSFFGSSTKVGISIGTSSIKVSELKKVRGGWSLTHFGVAQLPDGAIVNREILNSAAILDSFKQLLSQLKLKTKKVTISLSGAAVIVKRLSVEISDKSELEDAILWEAEQYIPFDINEIIFDYHLLKMGAAGTKTEVLLVAVKRAFYESYFNLVKEAGLEPEIVNVDILGLQDVFETNYLDEGLAVGIVDIGAASTKFAVCQNGIPIFTRDSALGGKDLTTEIQKHLNLSYQEAELLKTEGTAEGSTPQEITDLMQVSCENLAAEIKRSIDFYTASNAGSNISYILLAGGGSKLPGLSRIIEDTTSVPVQAMNPFTKIVFDPKVFNSDYISSIAPISALSLGLAIRGFDK